MKKGLKIPIPSWNAATASPPFPISRKTAPFAPSDLARVGQKRVGPLARQLPVGCEPPLPWPTSASSRRPRALSRVPTLWSDIARSAERVGPLARQLLVDTHRLFRGRAPPPPAQALGPVGQSARAVGSQLPVDAHRLFRGRQRLLPPPQIAQPVAQVVERPREVGQKRVGPLARQLPVDAHRLFCGCQRLLPPPQSAQQLPRLLSELARSGRNASGRWLASCRRMRAASSVADSASSRRPRSLSPLAQVVQRPGQRRSIPSFSQCLYKHPIHFRRPLPQRQRPVR